MGELLTPAAWAIVSWEVQFECVLTLDGVERHPLVEQVHAVVQIVQSCPFTDNHELNPVVSLLALLLLVYVCTCVLARQISS